MGHPSVSALLTLPVVYLPGFETLAAAVQSTADSLQKRTQVCKACKSGVEHTLSPQTRHSPPSGSVHGAAHACSEPGPELCGVPWPDAQGMWTHDLDSSRGEWATDTGASYWKR